MGCKSPAGESASEKSNHNQLANGKSVSARKGLKEAGGKAVSRRTGTSCKSIICLSLLALSFENSPFRAAEHRSKGRLKGVGCLSEASSRALRPLREAQGRPKAQVDGRPFLIRFLGEQKMNKRNFTIAQKLQAITKETLQVHR